VREETVRIDTMTFGGAGLGRIDGKVCFVPFTAVGDTVRVQIVTEKKSYLEGRVLDFLEPSQDRISPSCPVFGTCGGCCWQHMPYHIQLKAKEDIFTEILMRATRIDRDRIQPIVPSPEPYGYRSRMQFKMRHAGGALVLGFYRQGSHYVIDTPNCAIANEQINDMLTSLRAIMKTFPEPDKVPQIDIATGDTGDAIVLFHYLGAEPDHIAQWLAREIPGALPVTGVFLQQGRKSTIIKVWGDERVAYSLPSELVPGFFEMRLSFRCGGFSQVNYRQNSALVGLALRSAELKGTERVLDLFCGNGNFSLPLARYCAEVIGYENFDQSIEDAITNSRHNNSTNCRFYCADSATGVRELAERGEVFDLVLLDPPRTGARDVVRLLPQLDPSKILYISCDPSTLARDLASLQKSGYKIIASRPVDMFPQTYHLESITVLLKK